MVNSELIVIRFFLMCRSSQKKASKMLGIHRSIKSKTRPALGCCVGSLPALCMLCGGTWIREKQPKEQGAGVAACGEKESGTAPRGEEACS